MCAAIFVGLLVRRLVVEWRRRRGAPLEEPGGTYMAQLEEKMKIEIANERNERRQRAVDQIYEDLS